MYMFKALNGNSPQNVCLGGAVELNHSMFYLFFIFLQYALLLQSIFFYINTVYC